MVNMVKKDYNTGVAYFVADSINDIATLPTLTSPGKNNLNTVRSCKIGSVCYALNGNVLEKYMLFSQGWIKIATASTGGDISDDGTFTVNYLESLFNGTYNPDAPDNSGDTGITTTNIDDLFSGSYDPSTPDTTGDSGVTTDFLDSLF